MFGKFEHWTIDVGNNRVKGTIGFVHFGKTVSIRKRREKGSEGKNERLRIRILFTKTS